jgi:GNAT superfamily N-acetyltransferase
VGPLAALLADLARRRRGHVPTRLFRDAARACCRSRDTRAIVACDEERPSTIYGYAVWTPEPIALHMVYVRGFMRGFGLGKALALQACPVLRGGADHGDSDVRAASSIDAGA